MKILLINNEIWNDIVSGNNIFQNWFEGMDGIEIRVVCSEPGKPFNKVCNHYFQVTDRMMAISFFGRKAGEVYSMSFEEMTRNPQILTHYRTSKFYNFMKKISGTSIRLIREALWSFGRYNENLLKQYIEEFEPDIIFSPRLFNWKTRRLERLIKKYTSAPMVSFAGDDEVSYNQISYNPLFWINRFFLHRAFIKQLPLYSHYFTNSDLHAEEYRLKYGISASSLYKSGNFTDIIENKSINTPIKMVYAGRLYCNRWRTLAEIGKALKEINKTEEKIILEIYSPDLLSKSQSLFLNEKCSIYYKGMVSSKELKQIYKKADLALHVESFNRKYKLATRLSFSTKIIDLMASSCAILAIAWSEHAGLKYLKENDAAICITNCQDILPKLKTIVENPILIHEYSKKANNTGLKNHTKLKIQNQIMNIFNQCRK